MTAALIIGPAFSHVQPHHVQPHHVRGSRP